MGLGVLTLMAQDHRQGVAGGGLHHIYRSLSPTLIPYFLISSRHLLIL